MGVDLCVSCFR